MGQEWKEEGRDRQTDTRGNSLRTLAWVCWWALMGTDGTLMIVTWTAELNVSYGISCLSRSTSVTGIFFKKVTYGVAINTTQQEFSENLWLLSQIRLDECFRSPRKSARSIPDAFWVCWGLHPSLAQCPRPLIPSTDLSSHILVSWVHFLHTQHSLVVAGEKKDKTKPQYNTPEYLSTWVPHGGGQR